MHTSPSGYAGKTVKIKQSAKHPQFHNFGGSEFRVEDWQDRVMGRSWMSCDGNPACLVYAMRMMSLPFDNEVLYGNVGIFGCLVHISEIEEGT